LENDCSGGGEYSHGGIDSTGHYKLYGSNALKVIGARCSYILRQFL